MNQKERDEKLKNMLMITKMTKLCGILDRYETFQEKKVPAPVGERPGAAVIAAVYILQRVLQHTELLSEEEVKVCLELVTECIQAAQKAGSKEERVHEMDLDIYCSILELFYLDTKGALDWMDIQE